MRKILLATLALVLLAGAACTGGETETNPAAFGVDEDGSRNVNCEELDGENLHTLIVSIRPISNSVAPGEAAEFRARVVRKADLDPGLTADLPDASRADDERAQVEQPVEGALVAMIFTLPGLPAWGSAVTDEKGTATISVKVRRSAPAGTYDGNIYAAREVAEGPCVHLAEEGSTHLEEGLSVKK